MIRLSDAAQLHAEDCREAIKRIPDNSIDSCVTDPPYALVANYNRYSSPNAKPPGPGKDGSFTRLSRGFMGKQWDTGETAFSTEFWAEVYRVLKPGAFVAAFGASRGYHRMACAIEDAGFEIRDSLMWIYGTGFPKSQNVGKFIDKELGAEREVTREGAKQVGGFGDDWDTNSSTQRERRDNPVTPEAAEWDGWGTALKPAFEPIVLARKPLSEPTVAANVLRWRTGALNIDGCRVGSEVAGWGGKGAGGNTWNESNNGLGKDGAARPVVGRWPANVVTDGSPEVVAMFPVTKAATSRTKRADRKFAPGTDGQEGTLNLERDAVYNDAGGSAARFFFNTGPSTSRFHYSAKASKADRNGSKHPTVKPIALMEWLATLITPPGGTILDPFAGSGTTGVAARNKGFGVILCEREAEYIEDIKARFGFVESPPLVPCPVPALVLSPPPY